MHRFLLKNVPDLFGRIIKLKVETQDLEDRQIQLTVEVPAERLQAAMRSAARRLSKATKIPGFRPGKAPYDIIIGRFGEDAVFDEALENLGQEIYRQALDESEVEPYAPGSLDEIASREPLVLKYTVPLVPEVDLGKYDRIRVDFDEPDVTDEAFEKLLEDLRQSRALIEPANRKASLSDLVTLDVHAELPESEDEEGRVLMDVKGAQVLIDESTDWPIPGISDHLLEIEAEEEREFDHTFSEEYPAEDLRNLTAHFKLKCVDVKSRLVPEWSDDLARSIGEYEDLLDLRLKVRESMQEGALREAEAEFANSVIETAVEGATIEYPPILLRDELHEMTHELSRRLAGQSLTLDDYLKVESKTMEELLEELEPRARERLARALILGKIVETEEIEVDEQEITDQIDRMVEPFEGQADELRKAFDNPQGRQRVRLDLLTEKAIQRLVDIAKGEGEREEKPKKGTDEDKIESAEEPIQE
jgi:trigger factor